MIFIFLLVSSLFANRIFFTNKVYNKLNNYWEKDIDDIYFMSDYTKILNLNNKVKLEGYDERYDVNEIDNSEDIERIRNIFVKFNLLNILQNKNISIASRLELLKLNKHQFVDKEDDDFGNNFFLDISSHNFFKYLNFEII